MAGCPQLLAVQLFILSLTFSSSVAECPSPWVAFGSSCYFFGQTKANWFHAGNQCRVMGSSLVEIESATEDSWLRQKISALHANDDPQTIGYWTGANDLEVEGQWVWNYPLGHPLTYANWFPGEPNNVWYDKRPEDCVVLWGHDQHHYQWNDQPCDNTDFFICERPIETEPIGR